MNNQDRAGQNHDVPTSTAPRYSMVIQWSDESDEYVVTLPEWEAAGWSGHTGAKTYEAAAKRGRNMIENYIMWCREDGKALPRPNLFVDADEDESEDVTGMAEASSAV